MTKATATMPEVDLTTTDLSKLLGCSTRMVNVYRAAIEQCTGRTVGYRVGKATYYRPEEQQAIRQQREHGVDVGEVGANAQARATANASQTVATAEATMQTGLGDIVQQNDAQAIAMGQMLGQRFMGLMTGAMMETMSIGMGQMLQGMGEVTASLSCSVPTAPQLGGTVPNPFALAAGDESNGTGGGDWQP